jgi:hypothetical protein
MIEDPKGLFEVSTFKGLWFMYFKGSEFADDIYRRILPFISVIEHEGEIIDINDWHTDPPLSKCKISAIKFMQFIDMFNYYPVQVNKLRYKNDSDHLTRVLTNGTRGTADTTTVGGVPSSIHIIKDPEEKHLLKLLALVSNKLYERFATLQKAFRFLDTDHTQEITLNEFAQAIEHLRLKISFDDIRALF